MPAVYTVVSVLNTLFKTYVCILAVPAVFRVKLRRKPLLWIAAALLCVIVGVFRFKRVGPDVDPVVNWELFNTLLPYACVALLVPLKQIWKGFVSALGYLLVEALKYAVMIFFFREALQTYDDGAELIVELCVHLAAAVAVTVLLRYRNEKRNIFEPLLQLGPVMFVLIIANIGVFIVTLTAVSANQLNLSETKQLIFVFLNIPLFAATVGYAVNRLVKTQTAERAAKLQLEQQIKHYEMMEKMNEDLRIFRHDLPKKLRPLAAYLDNNDVASAAEIAHELTGFSAESDIRYHTGNYRLDTVLFCEQETAAPDGIRIVYTYGSLFPAEGIAPDDIYTIFPNALDNAIEACRKVEGEREITLASRIAGDTVYVTVKNPYTGKVTVKRGVPQTDKKDKLSHGYGFRSIKKAAANYGGDNVDVIAENGVFTLRLSLCFGSVTENNAPQPGQ